MRGIAKGAAARILALTAVFAFALCIGVAAGSSQKAYAEGCWDSNHAHYYVDGDVMVADQVYYVEEEGRYYFFDEYGFVETGWIKSYWDGDDAYWYGDPANDGMLKLKWQKIGGYWYYFAPKAGPSEDNWKVYQAGMMYDHGVAKVNGKYYYFGTSDDSKKWGKLQYGWTSTYNTDGDKIWYYADPNNDGQVAKGWKKVDGKWYYFEPNDPGSSYGEKWYDYGAMHYGGIETIKGHDYYFAKNGALLSGWIKEPQQIKWGGNTQKWNDWYYADPNNDSRLVTGWKKISGYWYFFDDDHEMVDNCTYDINGKCYIFDRSGKLSTKEGWINLYEEWTQSDGSTYRDPYWVYSNKSGIATIGWKKISGYWYYFSEAGYMQYDQWRADSKGWCYLGSNGKMLTSKWFYDDNDMEWYYFDESGHMVTGAKVINGKPYTFDEDGHWVP